jgi:hypothetical protein
VQSFADVIRHPPTTISEPYLDNAPAKCSQILRYRSYLSYKLCFLHQIRSDGRAGYGARLRLLLTLLPGHESGVGSSPTLIIIRLASVRYPRVLFLLLYGAVGKAWMEGALSEILPALWSLCGFPRYCNLKEYRLVWIFELWS